MLAYLVYIGLMVFMMICTGHWFYQHERAGVSYWGIRTWGPILVFAVITGLRYDVGLDFFNYYDGYVEQNVAEMSWDKYEPGFALLNKMLHCLQLPTFFLFMSIAFLQIFFFYKVFEDKPYMLSIGVFFLFTMGQVFGMMNIMRHFIAAMIVLSGFRYAFYKTTVWKFILCVICAALFHYSAVITLPVALFSLFIRPTFLDKRWVMLSIFIVVVMFQETLALYLLDSVVTFIFDVDVSTLNELGYNSNKLTYAVGQYAVDEGSGYGRLVNYVIVFFAILTSRHFYHIFGVTFLQYFRIYYWGQLLIISVGTDMNLRRIGMFYSLSGILVFTYIFYHVFSTWKKLSLFYQLAALAFCGYYLILFIHKIYVGESGCAPWYFI